MTVNKKETIDKLWKKGSHLYGKKNITKNKYKVETLTQSIFTYYVLIKKWTVFKSLDLVDEE